MDFFGYNVALRGQSPDGFFNTKFGFGDGLPLQVRTVRPNFTVVALKTWAYSRQKVKIGNFWYKFAPKGYVPLSDFFYKIWRGGGSPRSSQSRQLLPLSH